VCVGCAFACAPGDDGAGNGTGALGCAVGESGSSASVEGGSAVGVGVE